MSSTQKGRAWGRTHVTQNIHSTDPHNAKVSRGLERPQFPQRCCYLCHGAQGSPTWNLDRVQSVSRAEAVKAASPEGGQASLSGGPQASLLRRCSLQIAQCDERSVSCPEGPCVAHGFFLSVSAGPERVSFGGAGERCQEVLQQKNLRDRTEQAQHRAPLSLRRRERQGEATLPEGNSGRLGKVQCCASVAVLVRADLRLGRPLRGWDGPPFPLGDVASARTAGEEGGTRRLGEDVCLMEYWAVLNLLTPCSCSSGLTPLLLWPGLGYCSLLPSTFLVFLLHCIPPWLHD